MNIFSICTLCGGLAFFLFGMHVMSQSLEKIAGGKLEATLKKMTSNPFKSLALGAGITIAVQSSSAMTVMLVGLVNSGIMQLEQTVGVIMGSNIGTTLTAWLLSTAGIKSDNVLISIRSVCRTCFCNSNGCVFLNKKNKKAPPCNGSQVWIEVKQL